MNCIATKNILRKGKVLPIGSEITLDAEQYAKLRKDGAVQLVEEHQTLEQAKRDAAEFTAGAERSAEEERKRIEEQAEAEAAAALETAEPSEAPAPRRRRRDT